jgi:hypothetical protein
MVSMHNDLKRPRPGRPPKDLAGDVKAHAMGPAGIPQEKLSKRKSRRYRRDGAGQQADHLCSFPR